MIDLKKSLYAKLTNVTSRVYDNQTPIGTPYPYINTRYTTTDENEESHVLRVNLEIDIWDNIRDTTRLEQLADDIDNAINRDVDTSIYYKIFRLSPYRFELDDTDQKINRRQLRYIIHYVKQ